MNIRTEKLFLRRIASSWAGRRNMGGFSKEELMQLQALRIKALAYIVEQDGSTWVMLTETGQTRLYELNSLKDV